MKQYINAWHNLNRKLDQINMTKHHDDSIISFCHNTDQFQKTTCKTVVDSVRSHLCTKQRFWVAQ